MSLFSRQRSGFTLIELLVSMAIIGILASAVVASVSGARVRGRDAQRITDIKGIQVALSKYYDVHDKYPSAIGPAASSVLVTEGFMEKLPVDPRDGRIYMYAAFVNSTTGNSANCSSYHIGADLESNTHVGLQTDDDSYVVSGGSPANADDKVPSQQALCFGSVNDFHGGDSSKCNSADIGVACYDARP